MTKENRRRKRRNTATKAHVTAVALFFMATGAFSVGASAQDGPQTWRCGNTYSDRPCEGGKTVKVDDHRSDEDRRSADAGTRSARSSADQMERSRLSLEKAAYERDSRAAREARSAAQAERRAALAEQRERDRAHKAAREPRKSSMSFSGAARDKSAGDAPERKKKKRPSAE